MIEKHEVAQKEADKMKSEAKKLLAGMFGVPEGHSSGAVERIVDCIVFAAVLEISALNAQACKERKTP